MGNQIIYTIINQDPQAAPKLPAVTITDRIIRQSRKNSTRLWCAKISQDRIEHPFFPYVRRYADNSRVSSNIHSSIGDDTVRYMTSLYTCTVRPLLLLRQGEWCWTSLSFEYSVKAKRGVILAIPSIELRQHFCRKDRRRCELSHLITVMACGHID